MKAITKLKLIFIEPFHNIQDIASFMRSQLLAGVLLLVIILQLISLIFMPQTADIIPLYFKIAIVLNVLAYFLSRTRHFQMGAILWAVVASTTTFLSFYYETAMANIEVGFAFLIFSLLIPALVVDYLVILSIGIFNIAGVVAFQFGVVGLNGNIDLSQVLIFNIAATIIVTGLIYYRKYIEGARFENVRESEKNFIALTANMPGGVLVNFAGKHVFANMSIVKMLGYEKEEELIGTTIKDVVHPDELEIVLNNVRLRSQGKKVKEQYESLFISKTGDPVEVELHAAKTLWGGQEAIMVIARNISERIKAEKEFERVFELSPELLGTGNLEGYFTQVNSSFKRILGYEPEEFFTKPFIEFVYEEDVEKTLAILMEAVSGNREIYIENRYKCKDGSIKWIEWNVLALTEENKFYSYGRDITKRKLTEQALLDSEMWLGNIYNSLDEAVLVVDPDRNLINVNDAALKIFGYPKEEIINNPTELFHVDHEHFVEFGKRINQAFDKDQAAIFEFEAKRKNGEIFPTEHTVTRLKNSSGEIKGIVSVVRDISVRKKAAHELSEAYSLNEKIIDESPIGIAIYDHTGQCDAANNSVAKMVGATQEKVLKQNYNNIASWKKSGLYDAAKLSISKQEKQRHEFDVVTTFGKHGFYDCTFVPFKVLGKQHLLLMLDDISERKATENALKASELTLEKAQELTHIGHFIVEPATYAVTGSEELFRIFDFAKEGAIFENFVEVFHPDDREKNVTILQRAIEFKEAWDIEHRIICHDGTEKWVHAVGEVVTDEHDKVIELIGTVQDISERKVTEAELTKHRDHLEGLITERSKELQDTQDELVRKERLATLGQLTATVSHELRNPLGAMQPSLYIIEKKSDKKDEQLQKAIERIDRSISRCDRIIDELLDFTRITELNRYSIRFDDWLNSVINEQSLPEGILIKKDFSLKNVELDIDVDRLRRAVINVVDNACHAMMDDNQQLINHKDTDLIIKTTINNKRIEIIVTDKGIGLTDEVLDKVFEPLFSTKGFGVGLGMPTVKQIMEQHAGGIEIKSKEGKGTTVTLWLPMKVSDENVEDVEVAV